MQNVSIICTVVILGFLVESTVSLYVEGRRCTTASIFLFLAELVYFGIALVAAIVLVVTVVASLVIGQHRQWTVGALAVVVGASAVFWFCTRAVFLYGLRDGFRARIGYPMMRQFARELAQDDSLTDANGALYPAGYHGTASPAEQKQWDELVARYPFLSWNGGSRTDVGRDGSVELTWGSALVGHWGFEVAPEGTLSVPEKDRGRVLKVADDLQFVSYYD